VKKKGKNIVTIRTGIIKLHHPGKEIAVNLAKYIPIPLLFFIWTAAAVEGEENILSWEDCVIEARKNHPDLLASRASVEQAEANFGKSRSDLLPQISGSASMRHSKSSGDEASDSYSMGLSASQLIFDGLRSWYDLDQSEQSLISARLDYERESAGIRLSLREAFINLLEAQELIRITEEIAGRRKQQLDLVQLRYEAGREHRGSLLTSEANLAEAEFDIAQARRDVRVAQRQLHTEMGRTEFKPIKAAGSLDLSLTPAGEPDYRLLMEQHPSVLKLATERESARIEVKAARGDFFPTVSGSASISRSDSEWPPEDESWSVGVSLSLPLFEGGSRLEEVTRAKAALREAEENERRERDTVYLSLEEAWLALEDAYQRVAVQKKFLEATEERARISEVQYASGLLSFDNWIIIEDDLVRSRKSDLQYRANALKSEARWINARGGTLDFSTENLKQGNL
jgi:outer membrane protein TolC